MEQLNFLKKNIEDKGTVLEQDVLLQNFGEGEKKYQKYSSKKKIDNLNYNFSLDCRGEKCALSFYTKEKEWGLTGKGISTFGDVVDELSKLAKVAIEHDKQIKSINIIAAKEFLSGEEEKSFEKYLFSGIKKNPNCLNGYSDNINGLKIEGKGAYLTITSADNHSSHSISLQGQMSRGYTLDNLKKQQNYLPVGAIIISLAKFLKYPDLESKTNNITKKGQQRTMLYKRTLEKKFPEYEIKTKEINGWETIEIIVNKDELKENLQIIN